MSLCTKCYAMTSSLDGLRQLASKQGYKHLSVEEMDASATQGCPFCIILRNIHKKSLHSDAYIRIFCRNVVLQDHEVRNYQIQAKSAGHPFELAKLDYLQSVVWDDDLDIDLLVSRDYSEISKLHRVKSNRGDYLYPFTAEGQL
jgi:hypothetical protein